MLGGLLSLLSAAAFGVNAACARRGVLTGSVIQGIAVTVPLGVPLFLVVTVATGYLGAIAGFSTRTIILLSLAGIVHFVWGRYCTYRATRAIGANLAGNLQQFDIVLTLVLAIWILGETLTPLKVIGILLVLAGVGLKPPEAAKNDNGNGAKRLAFTPNYVEGYVFGLLTCTGYGASPILIRLALEQSTPGISLAGGLVSYTAAALFVLPFLLFQWRHVIAIEREGLKWFTLSGVLVCLSQMFRYMALSVAPVTVVQPIQRLSVLFRVLIGWFINRDHEIFDRRILVGTVLALFGALALTVSTDIVLAHVPLPDWAVALARWRWP